MPWLPEVFTAPVMEQILEQRRRDALVAVPYFDGLLAGDPDPLVESFAGEPEVHDPVRGRVKGAAAFRRFVAQTHAWLTQHRVAVEDVEHVVGERHGFEEVLLHLDPGSADAVSVPVAVVADRLAGGRIEEVRVYSGGGVLTGGRLGRTPLLQHDPDLAVPDDVAQHVRAHYERERGRGVTLGPCALVGDGRAYALEHNVVWPGTTQPLPLAALAVVVRAEGDREAVTRVYGDVDPEAGRDA